MKPRLFWLFTALILMGSMPNSRKSLLPPGFVLVAGTDSIQPFLISENPVSNYEYLIYMEWLRKVFVTYPEVYELAKPHAHNPGILFPCNDPYSSFYFGHPAFADYPVVGVNWTQAMEFCSWRNDRLNEALLVEMGNMDWKKELSGTMDDNNFNTEAYLNGQYVLNQRPTRNMQFFHYQKSGYFGKWDLPSVNYNNMKINSPDLFPEMLYGARLPSEEEWDYYMSHNGIKTKWYPEVSYNELADYVGISEGMKRRYGSNRDYAKNSCFINKNFREWMLDTFTKQAQKHLNLREILSAGGCYMPDMKRQFHDQYGALVAKDSLGRFGFRIFGWEPSGEALCLWRYGYKYYNYTRDIHLSTNNSFTDSVVAIFKENRFDSLRAVHKGFVPDRHTHSNGWCIYNYFGFTISGIQYYVIFNYTYQSQQFDIEYLKNTSTYIYNDRITCIGCENETGRTRVTKNKEIRNSEYEINGQNDLGFRILIPWYGKALPKPIGW